MPLASTSVLPFAESPALAGACARATPEPSATTAAAIATEKIVLMPKLLGFPGEAVPASHVLIRDASRTPRGLAIFENARSTVFGEGPAAGTVPRTRPVTSCGRACLPGLRPTTVPASPAYRHDGCGKV